MKIEVLNVVHIAMKISMLNMVNMMVYNDINVKNAIKHSQKQQRLYGAIQKKMQSNGLNLCN